MSEERPIDKLNKIKTQYKSGVIFYEEAKDMADEPLQELNKQMKAIADRNKKRHNPITFSYFFR